MDEKTTFSKCTNGINIDAQITGGYSKSIAGIVANGSGTFTKCANKGAIVFKGTGSWGTDIDVAGSPHPASTHPSSFPAPTAATSL